MEVSTILLFSLLLCGVNAIYADESLAALASRVRLLEGEVHTWKLTFVNIETTLVKRLEELESSLKEEKTGKFLPPLIKPLVKLAITDLMKGDYIGNSISGHVPEEVQSLSVQKTKTQLKAMAQQLRRVERDRDTYRKSLRKQRRRLTKDIRAFQLELNQTLADLAVARMLKSELNQSSNGLCDTKRKVIGLTEDFIALNTSCVMMRNEVESCMDGLQEIRLNLLTDIQSLSSYMNHTKEDLLDTKEVINGLKQDVMTLNGSCGIRKEMTPSDGNGSSLRSSSLSHTTLTTTFPGTTAASTDQDPRKTVPPPPETTQDSNVHVSTTDVSEDLTPSKTVPPTPVTTQDSDAHARGHELSSASEVGDLKRVKRILAAGHVDVNRRYGWFFSGRTPVMKAAENGHTDVVEFLVGRGADVSEVEEDGDNVLHLACYGGHLETVKFILSLNAVDINSRGDNSRTPVMKAAEYGHRNVVEFLMGRGANLSLVDRYGSNALHLACQGGDLETVKFILSLNVVDINSRGDNSRTPVMKAAEYGHRNVVEFLMGRGANLSLVDRYGNNALHFACRGGDLEMVKLILSVNVVDVNSRGEDSRTPVMEAARNGHRDVVEFLMGRGAVMSLVDQGGNNILHLACRGGDMETVKLILSLNVVNINDRNYRGQTATFYARYHHQVLFLMVTRGG